MSQSVTEGTAAADPQPRHRIRVLDTEISYVDVGRGHPIVFLHGNPTYSFLWRNIIPHLSGLGRCLAPDLVGMGHSGRSPTYSYRFVDHVRYLDAWFEALGLTKNLTLVVHDWGSAIGFHRAFRYPDQIRAIAYMEAIVQPMRWDDFGEAGGIFRMFRSVEGERLILDQNAFVERVLPRAILRTLKEDEMAAYRAPYGDREARLPTLIWPRQIPIRASQPMSPPSSSNMASGFPNVAFPSFSSPAIPARSSLRVHLVARSAGPGPISANSR